MEALEQEAPAVPEWIAALPGFDPAKATNSLAIGGQIWTHYRFPPHLDSNITLGRTWGEHYRIAHVSQGDRKWIWESKLNVKSQSHGDDIWFVDAKGNADSLEQAIALASGFDHEPTPTPEGHTWYRGHWYGREVWETRIGGQVVTAQESGQDGEWQWNHPVDLSQLEQLGIYIEHRPAMSGHELGLQEAMRAAAEAQTRLHASLLAMAGQLRPPPALRADDLKSGKVWRPPYSDRVLPCHCAATRREDCTCWTDLAATVADLETH